MAFGAALACESWASSCDGARIHGDRRYSAKNAAEQRAFSADECEHPHWPGTYYAFFGWYR
jgi:hypothetical protein